MRLQNGLNERRNKIDEWNGKQRKVQQTNKRKIFARIACKKPEYMQTYTCKYEYMDAAVQNRYHLAMHDDDRK